MGRHELAIEQGETARLHACDEPGQRYLRRIGHPAEHALPKERSPELHAVEAADKLAFVPDLDGMGMARPVEREHRAFDVAVDPRLLAVRAGCNYRRKVTVYRNREFSGSNCAAQRFRQMEAVERYDRARSRLHPEQFGRLAAVRHRKDAGGIALQQQARVETTHCLRI